MGPFQVIDAPLDCSGAGRGEELAPAWDELVTLARPLATAPDLARISVADFSPDRDPDGARAARVVEALQSKFRR